MFSRNDSEAIVGAVIWAIGVFVPLTIWVQAGMPDLPTQKMQQSIDSQK